MFGDQAKVIPNPILKTASAFGPAGPRGGPARLSRLPSAKGGWLSGHSE